MARKKLSPSQREAIRKEILKRLRAGASRTAVSRDLSEKYHVSTVTIRWYIKSLKGTSVATRTAPVSLSGSTRAMKLLDIVKNVSEEGLARALAAKKLFVQLQQKLAETERLRRAEREVQRSLQLIAASARQLEKKLHKLTVR
ncbi:MAG: HTH domain-containing protein [Planctomycetota bacterium]|nr:MAG: HTH domain-containing protein [Planctomycetota bacterium]